jgi:hypothetical protein
MEDYSTYVKNEWGGVVGKTITSVRQLSEDEAEGMGWDNCGGAVPVVFMLNDGSCLIPSQDPEGNGPGHIFVEQTEAR